MTEITLDDGDRALLRDCPMTLDTPPKPNQALLHKLRRIKRLWSAGLIGGTVTNGGRTMRIVLKNPGRAAIGRAPVPEAATDA